MNRCAYPSQQQKAALVGLGLGLGLGLGMSNYVGVGGDSFFNSSSSSSMAAACPNGVVCPKPRRLVNNDPINVRPSRIVHTNNQQMESCESRAGSELLDIILAKGNYGAGAEKPNFQVASSPPFFNGSPPVRASNPLIQDEQFGIGKMSPLSSPPVGSSASPQSRKNSGGGSSGRVKCGNQPAPVRIEGFNCRGISAVMA